MSGSHPLTPGFLGESSKFLRVPRMSGPRKALARGWGFLWALLPAWLLPRDRRAMQSLRKWAGRGHAEAPGELGERLPSPARLGVGRGPECRPPSPVAPVTTPSGPCPPAPSAAPGPGPAPGHKALLGRPQGRPDPCFGPPHGCGGSSVRQPLGGPGEGVGLRGQDRGAASWYSPGTPAASHFPRRGDASGPGPLQHLTAAVTVSSLAVTDQRKSVSPPGGLSWCPQALVSPAPAPRVPRFC